MTTAYGESIIIVNVAFFADQCVRWHRSSYNNDHGAACGWAVEQYGGLYFLSIAVMLTINRWIYFNMRLSANIYITHNERVINDEPDQNIQSVASNLTLLKVKEARRVEWRYFVVNVISATIIIGYSTHVFYYLTTACFSDFT